MLRKASFLLGDQSMKSFWIPDSSHSGPLASLTLGQICLGIVPSLDLLRLQLDSEYCVSNAGRELTITLFFIHLFYNQRYTEKNHPPEAINVAYSLSSRSCFLLPRL